MRKQVHLVDGDRGDAFQRVVAVLLGEMFLLGILDAAPVDAEVPRDVRDGHGFSEPDHQPSE